MNTPIRRASVLATAVATAIVIAACGGGDGGLGVDRTADEARAAIQAGSQAEPVEPGVFERLLEFVPDTSEHSAFVQIENLAAIRDSLGIEAPDVSASEEEVDDYLKSIVTGLGDQDDPIPFFVIEQVNSRVLSGLMRLTHGGPPSAIESLGFDARHVDGSIYSGTKSGPANFTFVEAVVASVIDPELASQLLANCGECPGHETLSQSGTEFMVWGEDQRPDLRERLSPPVHDQFGRGGRLLLGEGYAARTLRTDVMRQVIDGRNGVGSLVGDRDFVDLVRVADELGALSLTITDRSFGLETTVDDNRTRLYADSETGEVSMTSEEEESFKAWVMLLEERQSSLPLPSFSVAGTGISVHSGNPRNLFFLVFEDDVAAESGRGSLHQRLAGTGSATESGTVGRVAWAQVELPEDLEPVTLLISNEYIPPGSTGSAATASIFDVTMSFLLVSE